MYKVTNEETNEFEKGKRDEKEFEGEEEKYLTPFQVSKLEI